MNDARIIPDHQPVVPTLKFKILAIRRGAVLPLVAVSMVALMSLVALVVDGSALQREKKMAQTAADAGALAGAVEIFRGRPDSVSFAAKSETKRNGFQHLVNGVVVTPTYPATGSVFNGAKFVRVVVQRNVPTILAGLFGQNSVSITASATGGIALAEYCFVVLEPTAANALQLSNGASLTGSGCGVEVNSTSPTGANAGGSGDIIAPAIGVAGSSVGGVSHFIPAPTYNVPPTPDPLGYLTMPAVPNTCDHGNLTVNTPNYSGTLNPGTYCGGIDVSGTVNLTAGLYILRGGGLNVTGGGGTLRSLGTGVTILNTAPPAGASYTWGPIYIQSGSVTLDLGANTDPSSPLPGVLFFGDRSAPPTVVNVFRSGSVSRMDGTMYFPTQTVQFSSGSSFTINGALVANKVSMSQNTNVTFTGYNGGASYFALRRPTIVE